MKKMILAALMVVTVGHPSLAQKHASREEVLADIAKTMDEIRRNSVSSSQSKDLIVAYSSGSFDEALKQANALYVKYKDNPYVTIKGFSVGFPWGISIDVEFRQ